MAYYMEVAAFDGSWMPQRVEDAPTIHASGGHQRLPGGARVRAVIEIPSYFDKLTLSQLREVFSPDGKFYNTTKRVPNGG